MENTPLPNSTSILENTESAPSLYKTVGDIFQLVVLSVVFLFGVPGNCFILRVYWTKTLTTSTQVFIMALAWADLAACMMSVYDFYKEVSYMTGYEVPSFTLYIWDLNNIAIGASVIMTAVIALDRYDCVCRPQRRFFTHKRGKVVALSAFVFSLVFNTPAFIPKTPASEQSLRLLQLAFQAICFIVALVMIALCYGKVYATIKKHTKVDAMRTTRDFSVSQLADECSTRLQDAVFTNLKPNSSAVASVSTLISKPCSTTAADANRMAQGKGAPSHQIDESTPDESRKRRARIPQATWTKHENASKDTNPRVVNGTNDPLQHQSIAGRAPPKPDAAVLQRKTTRMLFITSVVFCLTWLPYWIYITTVFAFYLDRVFNTILLQLSIIFYVNHAVNPLIYGLANRRFRKDCKTVLSKIKLC